MSENLHQTIWRLTWPNVLSNITVPLLGMTDIAIAGMAGADTMIGSVSVGSSIFNFLYMNCAFLRMGTTGLTAQAFGARNDREAVNILYRAISVALFVAIFILTFNSTFTRIAVVLMGGSEQVMAMVGDYISVRLWALPAALMLFVYNGWFVGMQDAKTPLFISIVTNLTNIAASALFTLKMNYGIQGIAWGTVVAQYVSVIIALVVFKIKYSNLSHINLSNIYSKKAMLSFFQLNGNVFVRSFFISLTYTIFTHISANISDTVLATNTLLMQLFTLFSYIFDGCAFAAESLSGRFIGQKSGHLFRKACRYLFLWGGLISISYTLVYLVAWHDILTLFSPSDAVMNCAADNIYYIILIPLLGYVPFMIDGILFGATRVKPLMLSAIGSFVVFISTEHFTIDTYNNDGLWIAFLAFTATRGLILLPIMSRIYIAPFK